ncbi:MAG: hypothetical protein KGJ23_12275 [Euryarchaeota archaeon]|nr:hypothetical protein [Euryarchaeota archaeon]MDE1837373.1 hypothetical protein [Euryarchaeota archaeon]MDE1881824.1 hypothetical protein [Euryarchaeota archaeon]MDE2045651.1 hypothetical protein [Thermoplasmata archaeon]
MKLVQAQIPEAEYQLLKRRAHETSRTLQEVIREAIREHVLPDRVDPQDPLLRAWPTVAPTGKRERGSVDHDRVLYGKRT